MSITAKLTLLAIGSAFTMTAGALAGGTIVKHEAASYQSIADSPLFSAGCDRPGVEFYLETFEDGLLNVPGVDEPNEPGFIATPGANTDSVEAGGRSLVASAATMTFTFEVQNGSLPTRAGFAITDTATTANAPFTFFVMSGDGEPGIFNVNIGNASPVATKADDKFVGFSCPDGIAFIQVSAPITNFEIDHLQYSRVPAAGTALSSRGDMDGSGTGDIIFHQPGGPVTAWYLNDLVEDPEIVATGVAATWIFQGFGDLDGDCDDDMIWRSTLTPSKVRGWIMENGQVVSMLNIVTGLGQSWKITAINDFDGNGTADLFMQQDGSNSMRLWFMDGVTITSAWTVASPGGFQCSQHTVISSGDVDGDGKADILWRSKANGTVSAFKMNGAVVAAWNTVQVNLTTTWTNMGGGDLDGDGDLDLTFRSASNGNVLFMLLNPNFTVATTAQVSLASGFTFVGFPDVNGDGAADLVWRKDSDGKIVRWLMNGIFVLNSQTVGTGPTTSGVLTHGER